MMNCKKSIQELLLYLNSSKIEHVTNNSIEKPHNYVTEVKQEADEEVLKNWILLAARSDTIDVF